MAFFLLCGYFLSRTSYKNGIIKGIVISNSSRVITMKLFKTFIIGSALALVVSLGAIVSAQTLVATVNIENARVVSQVGNQFTLAFSLTNREGVQSGVHYGIKLVSETPKGQFVVDQEVFDEALTLSAGVVVDREVSYSAPANMEGSYTVFVTSMNENGFPFATAYVGKATLSPVKKGLMIDPASCKTAVAGASYTLAQSFSTAQGVAPTLTCDVTNYSGAPLLGTPTFEIHAGSPFGKSIELVGASTTPTPFLLGERKVITFTLPSLKDAGIYYATVGIDSDTTDNGTVSFKYSVEGVTASIDNFSFDKTSYKKGDLAKMSLVWRASLADNSVKAKANPDVALSLTVTNAVGTKCIAPVEQMLSRASAVKNITVPVVANCTNPKAVVTLSDKEGTVLATRTFLMEGTSLGVSRSLMLAIIIGIIVVLVLAIVLHLRKKKDMTTPTTLPTMMLLPFLVFIALGMFSPKTAHADTYTYNTPEGDTIITEVNLDSPTYSPNGLITITASIENINNSVPYNRSYPVRLIANNNSGASVTIIPQTTLAPGITPITRYDLFQAPDPAPATSGSYAVNFTTGVDIGISVPTVTGFHAGPGWSNLGTPLVESSISSSAPAMGESILIRFDLFREGLFYSQETTGAELGRCDVVYTGSCALGVYGETQGGELESYVDWQLKNVCIESYSSGLYVDPAWLCN